MPSKPGRRLRCGAKCRRKNGAPCERWAVNGANRCRQHGGATLKGGDAPQATQRLKHGLFAKAFSTEEKARFAEVYEEMLVDPTGWMMANAALMQVKAATALARADAAGMVAVRRAGAKTTSPVVDSNGQPIFYVNDAGERKPLLRQTENIAEERADVMPGISTLLMNAGSLAERSVMLKKRAELSAGLSGSELDDTSIAEILKREFQDAGAYGVTRKDKDPDASEPPRTAGDPIGAKRS